MPRVAAHRRSGTAGCDGFLTVTGRKKALIITAYGKNISPEMIETGLRGEPLISQAVVIGDDRPYLAALLTIDPEAAAQWARTEALLRSGGPHGGSGLPRRAPRAIDASTRSTRMPKASAAGAAGQRLHPGGELTPTLKVKRDVVMARYADVIDEMYAAPA